MFGFVLNLEATRRSANDMTKENTDNSPQIERTLEGAPAPVVYADLLALAAFLAKYQADLNRLRYEWLALRDAEAIKDNLVGQWPVIQGLRNQLDLKEIGEMANDMKAVKRGINQLLRAKDIHS